MARMPLFDGAFILAFVVFSVSRTFWAEKGYFAAKGKGTEDKGTITAQFTCPS
uniref:hypothetical protein n=1 Tax=uncultured Bacteroides sp. TaxID=162156 RepID=UPI0025F03A6D|nr:hypothetical protein [uncultured Bacteroides sp.]